MKLEDLNFANATRLFISDADEALFVGKILIKNGYFVKVYLTKNEMTVLDIEHVFWEEK